MLQKVLDVIEGNEVLCSSVLCEPQLGKRGLYPTLSTKNSTDQVRDMMNLLAYSDGTCDLIEIAKIINMPVWELLETVRKLKSHNLLIPADAH